MEIDESTIKFAARIIRDELGDRFDNKTTMGLTRKVLLLLQHAPYLAPQADEASIRAAVRYELVNLLQLTSREATPVTVTQRDVGVNEPSGAPRPPLNAEFFLHLLLREEEQEALIGCLVEQYGRKFERLGKRRADLWFYAEVARSTWPLARRFAAKAVKVAVLGEWIRRMIQ